jgi:hypothetical protein
MAKQGKEQKQQGEQVEVKMCKAEGCKHKPSKFGFCTEHYEMYMAGVIKGDGSKPIDYEQKLSQYLRQKQKQAA